MDEVVLAWDQVEKKNVQTWSQALIHFLEKLSLDQEELAQLHELLLKESPSSQDDYNTYLKRFFFYQVLVFKNNQEISQEVKLRLSTFSHFYPSTLSRLIDLCIFYDETKALQTDRFFNLKEDLFLNNVVDLNQWIENTAILFLIAQKHQNNHLLALAQQMIQFLASFLSKKEEPLATLFSTEKNYNFEKTDFSFDLLKALKKKLFSTYCDEEKEFDTPSLSGLNENQLFLIFLKKLTLLENVHIGKENETSFLLTNQSSLYEKIATITYQGENLSGALTLCGMNSSLGTIHIDDVKILTMGFQYFPLSSVENFGQFRPFRDEKTFDHVKLLMEKKSAFLEGWTRLCKNAKGSNLWTEMKASFKSDKCHLNFCFHEQQFQEKIAFVFYVQAKSCQIEKRTLIATSLEQYFGALSNRLSFRGKLGALTVQAKGPTLMHIIPLAGNNCFWGANFLLAYEIEPLKDYHFMIKKT
jgi:hypothetical protein